MFDRPSGTFQSIATLESGGSSDSNLDFTASLSPDGNRIAFASDVDPNTHQTTLGTEIYVYDRNANTYTLASVNGNTEADGDSVRPQSVRTATTSSFRALRPTWPRARPTARLRPTSIILRKYDTARFDRRQRNARQRHESSYLAGVTANGTEVTFGSTATNLVPGDASGKSDVYVVDLAGGAQGAVTEDVNLSPQRS